MKINYGLAGLGTIAKTHLLGLKELAFAQCSGEIYR